MNEDTEDEDNEQTSEDAQEDTGEEADASEPLEEHRSAVGEAVAQAQSQGLDMTQLAQQLGLSTDDVNAMNQGDLMSVAKHLAAEHPEIAQNLLGRIPVVGGFLGGLLGGIR
ncbi:MAG: hypothetical protein QM758_04115 [Armatimonas sp.]